MNPNPPSPQTESSTAGARVHLNSATLLWASAFILLGLVIVQSGRVASHWLVSPAKGDVVSRVADYTTSTVFSGSGSEDILVVLDGRGEQVFTYRIRNRTTFEFIRRYDLPTLFELGSRIGPGRAK